MHIRSLALAAISLSAFATATAQAQTPDGNADTTIIVTAQLREQDAIDVPMALSVVGSQQLDRFGLYEFDSLSRFVPGFVVQNQSPNNPGFVMRGITSDSGTATNEPRVSVFQDGVSISKSRGSSVRRRARRDRQRAAIDALWPRRFDRSGQHRPEQGEAGQFRSVGPRLLRQL
jgi:iron complex outermembrane receptor protein